MHTVQGYNIKPLWWSHMWGIRHLANLILLYYHFIAVHNKKRFCKKILKCLKGQPSGWTTKTSFFTDVAQALGCTESALLVITIIAQSRLFMITSIYSSQALAYQKWRLSCVVWCSRNILHLKHLLPKSLDWLVPLEVECH